VETAPAFSGGINHEYTEKSPNARKVFSYWWILFSVDSAMVQYKIDGIDAGELMSLLHIIWGS
jgi:hypothetical protein